MITVVEWATPPRPRGRFPWVAHVVPLTILGIVSASGAYVSVATGRGWGEIALWIAIGLLPLAGVLILLRLTLATVLDEARRAADDSAICTISLFTSSAVGSNIASWRDWKHGDEKGKGFFLLRESELHIWTAGDGSVRTYAWDEIEYLEDVRVWAKWIWSPQLRIHFCDGTQFIAALSHAGPRSACGFSDAEMRILAQEFENRSPGINARRRRV